MITKMCEGCKTEKRITQFSLIRSAVNNGGEELRRDECRTCNYDGLTASERADIIKEAYRHFPEFRRYAADTGRDVISYAVPKEAGSDEYEVVDLSLVDLSRALENVKLAPRKKQAFELNILQDMLYREAAAIMGITTVSVGQYVNQAATQLADWYFADEDRRKALEESYKLSDSDEE